MVTLLATAFVFGIIVMVHELGHFLAAKLFRIPVSEFAIGLGPKILTKRWGDTEYTWRLLPLGGFNRIEGMDPDEADVVNGFAKQAIWKRMIVIAAGAVMNFILGAMLFFTVMYTAPFQQPLPDPVIGTVTEGSPAAQSHFMPGDRIITINGKPITQWSDITPALQGQSAKSVSVIVERQGKKEDLLVIPENSKEGKAVIGILPSMSAPIYMSASEAAKVAITTTVHASGAIFAALVDIVTGNASNTGVSGPIGVARMAGEVANYGFIPLLSFTAFLSINLGIINLLPLPVLDGGHLVLLTIEAITRKRPSKRLLMGVQLTGMAILLLIFLYATANDLHSLF